jgi:hypothetical protein
MKQSARFTLNEADVQKWSKNAVTFFAPAALLFLLEIQSGKSWKEALVALELWALNTAIDLLRKFLAGK